MSKKQGKQEAKEIVEKQSQELTSNLNSEYSGNEEASASDIIVPRILLMQGTSKWVPETFNMGDIIDSVEEVALAKKGETLTILPFIMEKTWQVFTDEQPPAWVRTEKWNAANDQAEWKFTEEDEDRGVVEMFRQRNYGFYCFVLDKDGAIDEFAVPALINFRSSSGFKEGKKIASWFARMKSMKQPGFTVTWDISTETIKDSDKSYQKFVVKRGETATDEQKKPIMKWLALFAEQRDKIKDHEAEEAEVVSTPVGTTAEPQAQAQF